MFSLTVWTISMGKKSKKQKEGGKQRSGTPVEGKELSKQQKKQLMDLVTQLLESMSWFNQLNTDLVIAKSTNRSEKLEVHVQWPFQEPIKSQLIYFGKVLYVIIFFLKFSKLDKDNDEKSKMQYCNHYWNNDHYWNNYFNSGWE